MPPLPSPGNVIKVTLRWTIGADTNVMNVLHYRYSGGRPAANDCNAIAAHLAAANMAVYLGACPLDVAMTQVLVVDLQGNDGQQGAAPSTHVGTGTGTMMPASGCFVLHLGVNARYRGGHPRIYFPGFQQSAMQDAQTWVAGTVSAATTSLTTFLASLVGFSSGSTAVGSQCAVSYYNKAINPTPPHLRPTPLVLDVTSWSGMQRIGSQRRRLVPGR